VHLDETLEEMGYTLLDTTSVQTLNLDHIGEPKLTSVVINEDATSLWLENFCRLIGRGNQPHSDVRMAAVKAFANRRGVVPI